MISLLVFLLERRDALQDGELHQVERITLPSVATAGSLAIFGISLSIRRASSGGTRTARLAGSTSTGTAASC